MALGSFFGADFAGDFEIDTLQMTLSDGGVVLNVDKDFILMEINILLFIATAIIELVLVLVAWRLGKSYLQAFIIMNIVLTGLFVGVLPWKNWIGPESTIIISL